MPAPLLANKLFVPPTPPRVVSRPRLVARLAESQVKLVLLSAPPGYGKTTLLSGWVHASNTPTAWLSLDDGDNDPARFQSYLVAALESLGVRLNEHILASSQSPQMPSLDAPLILLLNAASSLRQPQRSYWTIAN